MEVGPRPLVIFDPLYGFIHLTPIEREILHSPFYQRLRWIKQLGLSCYVFPGAEHSRYGHSIGVMHNAHLILNSVGRAVSYQDLMNPQCRSKEKMYHQSVRLGALMHDLGTFCFSHTTEVAYIKFGETAKNKADKQLRDDHENLGSFIIKNTDYSGGITSILKRYGHDPQTISNLVKGTDPSIMANQILHSEIDCDRMDYLLRDAHYTGLKYGSYDRDYLLYHFEARRIEGHDILTIKHNALRCVEDFLCSRFAWYSQVIRSPHGAKYDAIAEQLCFYFLQQGWIYRYSDLLDMIHKRPINFWGFNDGYFINLLHQRYADGSFDGVPAIKDMAETLLFAKIARHVRCPEFVQRLIDQDDPSACQKNYQQALAKMQEIQGLLQKEGGPQDWMIGDLPTKEIIFIKSYQSIVRHKDLSPILHQRDPVKISYENGEVKVLAEVENSIISRLHQIGNFVPNVFVNQSAYDLLVKRGLTEDVRPGEMAPSGP